MPPCTPTSSSNKWLACRALLHSITAEPPAPSYTRCLTPRTTPCFLFASWASSNQRSAPHPLPFFPSILIALTALLQIDASHIFTVDVSYTNSNTDEFYYFYFDGVLAIERSPAVCLPLASCNVGTYTVSLLASEFYRLEMRWVFLPIGSSRKVSLSIRF